jgi:hypothetical protein
MEYLAAHFLSRRSVDSRGILFHVSARAFYHTGTSCTYLWVVYANVGEVTREETTINPSSWSFWLRGAHFVRMRFLYEWTKLALFVLQQKLVCGVVLSCGGSTNTTIHQEMEYLAALFCVGRSVDSRGILFHVSARAFYHTGTSCTYLWVVYANVGEVAREETTINPSSWSFWLRGAHFVRIRFLYEWTKLALFVLQQKVVCGVVLSCGGSTNTTIHQEMEYLAALFCVGRSVDSRGILFHVSARAFYHTGTSCTYLWVVYANVGEVAREETTINPSSWSFWLRGAHFVRIRFLYEWTKLALFVLQQKYC